MLRTCYEYVPRQSCIAAERTKNYRVSGRTQRHSLPQNGGSAQPQRQFVPQAFFLKLSNIMLVAAAAAMPRNTFDSLYRPECVQKCLVLSTSKRDHIPQCFLSCVGKLEMHILFVCSEYHFLICLKYLECLECTEVRCELIETFVLYSETS